MSIFKIDDKVQVKKGIDVVDAAAFEQLPHGKMFIVTDVFPLDGLWLRYSWAGKQGIRIDGKPASYFANNFEKIKTVGFVIE
jgi:hypothetical protein